MVKYNCENAICRRQSSTDNCPKMRFYFLTGRLWVQRQPRQN